MLSVQGHTEDCISNFHQPCVSKMVGRITNTIKICASGKYVVYIEYLTFKCLRSYCNFLFIISDMFHTCDTW